MSGFGNNISNSSGINSSAEPSMEEILASIRRILKEDDTVRSPNVDIDDDVLVLDASMLARPADFSSATTPPAVDTAVGEAHPGAPVTSYHENAHIASEPEIFMQDFVPETPDAAGADVDAHEQHEHVETNYAPYEPAAYEPAAYEPAAHEPVSEDPMPENVEPPHGLMSEESSNAAANSIGALIRSISTERSVAVSRGGITIEDIVREEIRPVLKAWLDSHLPSLVERLVRAEIERVVERGAS